jgi:hypothetical protein
LLYFSFDIAWLKSLKMQSANNSSMQLAS